jgi:hypothetical protein
MKEHADLLRTIIDRGVIERVDDSSDIDVALVKELYDAGLIDAADACSFDGLEFLDVKPNFQGREWLAAFDSDQNCMSVTPVEDIIDVKPNFMGVGLNLNALLRKLFRKKA